MAPSRVPNPWKSSAPAAFRRISGMLALAAGMAAGSCTTDSTETGSHGTTSDSSAALSPEGCERIGPIKTLRINGLALQLKAPEGQPVGDILLLPPWDENEETWCLRSRICSKALKKGYRLVMPAMGRSMYCMQVYPETREDWHQEPTYRYLADTLIPTLQQRFCLLKPDGNNFVIGVGAGARGTIRLIQQMPALFSAAAALSGDYDPSLAPKDNLYRGFLGDYDTHKSRWTDDENLCTLAASIRTPLLLGHGQSDDYTPSAQTELLYTILRQQNPDLNIQYSLSPNKGHDFAYWNSEINDIFHFFETAHAAHAEAP